MNGCEMSIVSEVVNIMDNILNSIVAPLSSEQLNYKEALYSSLIIDASSNLILSGCPSLKANKILRSDDLYAAFVNWCFVNNKKMDWRLPLSFYDYLIESNEPVTEETHKELIFLACSQWTYTDKSANQTFVLCHTSLPSCVFGSNKSLRAEKFREVFYLKTQQLDDFLYASQHQQSYMYWILANDNDFPTSAGTLL